MNLEEVEVSSQSSRLSAVWSVDPRRNRNRQETTFLAASPHVTNSSKIV